MSQFACLAYLSSNKMTSAFREIISQLERQRTAIDRAIAALQEVGEEGFEQAQAGRAPVNQPSGAGAAKKGPAKKTAGRRTLSAEARQRIAAAQRKRWAAAKKATKKQQTK